MTEKNYNENKYNTYFKSFMQLKKSVYNRLINNNAFTKKFINKSPYAVKYVEQKIKSKINLNNTLKTNNNKHKKYLTNFLPYAFHAYNYGSNKKVRKMLSENILKEMRKNSINNDNNAFTRYRKMRETYK
jgi:hypothetical protein